VISHPGSRSCPWYIPSSSESGSVDSKVGAHLVIISEERSRMKVR